LLNASIFGCTELKIRFFDFHSIFIILVPFMRLISERKASTMETRVPKMDLKESMRIDKAHCLFRVKTTKSKV
jgi:hypothetical protein